MTRLSLQDMRHIAESFKQGKIIVFPTETSYGIGCDATNEQAVARVIAIKHRRSDKGLPVLVRSLEEARKHILFNERALELARKFWPGPLNILGSVVPRSTIVTACHKDGRQGLRQSSSLFVRALFESIDFPIVATSANLSGKEACYSAEEVWAQFELSDLKPDFIVDAGVLPHNPASTMVRVSGDQVDVIRFGAITI